MNFREAEEFYYKKLFSILDSDKDGKVSGKESASFLRSSGLNESQLAKIWDLADSSRSGILNQSEFDVVMRLISLAQSGSPISLIELQRVCALPKFHGIPRPSIFPSEIANDDLKKYDQLFLEADTDKDGFLNPNEAKAYFSKSHVSVENLRRIWDLSEIDMDGKLSKFEFRLAMQLIYWCLKGEMLPNSLPRSLISQAFENKPLKSVQITEPKQSHQTTQPFLENPMTSQKLTLSQISVQPQSSISSVPIVTSRVPTFNEASFSGQFVPPAANHNYNQSNLINQHTLPGASFEQRANLSNELNAAISRKKK